MGIHVPQKHLDYMKDMKATFDLTKLTKRQLTNVKKYYQKQDLYGDTITKYIAKNVWYEHGINDHPHMEKGWAETKVHYFPCNHKVWKDIEQYLVMCKLADTNVYDIAFNVVNTSLEEMKHIIASGSSEPTTATFPPHRVQYKWRQSNNHMDVPEDCVLKKLLNGIHNTMVPMSDEQSGMKVINNMIDGSVTEYIQTYIGENND